MTAVPLTPLLVVACLACIPTEGRAADGGKNELQGVWGATAIEISGKPVAPEEVKAMRFTFKGDKLLVMHPTLRGREVEGTFKTEGKKSPKQLDIDLIKLSGIFPGIYEVKGDELRICYVTGGKTENRPTKFATTQQDGSVLVVFKRKKP